jgi:hypothetical protein
MIKEVTVNYGKTVNMGNFNSFRIDVSMTKTILEGSDVNAEVDKTFASLDKYVNSKVAQAFEKAKQ